MKRRLLIVWIPILFSAALTLAVDTQTWLSSDGMDPVTSQRTLRLDGVVDESDPPIKLVSNQNETKHEPLIASITKETLWRNRDGTSQTWFHPRACMMPGKNGQAVALMTLQPIGGSDYFGQVHWSMSSDLGKTWTDPEPIPR